MKYISLLRALYQFKKHEKMSAYQMQQYQKQKLNALLLYAYDHSQYYRSTFQKAGITRNLITQLPLSSFPTIDKKTLIDNFDTLITVNDLNQEDIRIFDEREESKRSPYKNHYHVVHSSGSTGKPSYFIYDEQAWQSMLLGIIRGALWDMSMLEVLCLLLSRPRIMYIAATDGRYGGAMAVGDGIDGIGAKQMFLDINTPLDQWITAVETFKPNIIIGYPSAIKILARLKQNGKTQLHLKRIISCGEPLNSDLRSFLEDTFACKVINLYGASESLALGVETGNENGMLLFDDLNVIEIENGEMYLTCLYNFAQPLIRYHISDQLVLKKPLEYSPFQRAEIVLGRNEDLLWFTNKAGKKEFLHPLSVEGFCIEGLQDYQFKQVNNHAFKMLAQTTTTNSKQSIQTEMFTQMNRILKEKHLQYVTFSIEFVDEITPNPYTGKKTLILSNNMEINL